MTMTPTFPAPRARPVRLSRALPALQQSGRRKLIIRGDLRSATGYGYETRALAELLRERFEVLGVDVHHNPVDDLGRFPGVIISDEALSALGALDGPAPIVLHHTPPDTFLYTPGAINIGAFAWETDAIPYRLDWPEMIQAMDHMWAKTRYVHDFIRSCGYARPVAMVAWPFDFQTAPSARPQVLASVQARLIEQADGTTGRTASLQEIRSISAPLFLSVKSLAPRKGLPILLSEWRDFIGKPENHGLLLLKLRFMHNSSLADEPAAQVADMLAHAGFRSGDRVRIAYLADDVTPEQMKELYRLADAYVTASYGEGFGGPLVESLLLDRPVIAARHTGAQDLLPPDYALSVGSDRRYVGLRGASVVYPQSASWRLPRQGELVGAFERFQRLDTASRLALTREARAHAAAFCSVPVVGAAINAFFDEIGV